MNLPKVFSKKKVLLIILAVIMIGEIIWAFWMLSKAAVPKTQIFNTQIKKLPAKSASLPATISLIAAKTTFKVGEIIPVTIKLYSEKLTDGADVIIIYNPELLAVQKNPQGLPVSPGILFNQYPANLLDEKNGRIIVSGVSSAGGVLPQGVFGALNLKAQKSGKTQLIIEFTPGSTIDSNLSEAKTGNDLLEKVENLNLEISQ